MSLSKVLVFQGGKFGDAICTTPMFRAIKEHNPTCQVIVVGSRINKVVLDHNPHIDAYIEHNEKAPFETIRHIRRMKIDFACITAPSPVGLGILYLSGIPSIAAPTITAGWSPFETRAYKIIRKFVIQKKYVKGEYTPRSYLKLLEPIGIFTKDTKKDIYWSSEAESKVTSFLDSIETARSFRVGIMPGAGNKIKEWPPERFAEVADHLIAKHDAHIFLIGNESNRQEIDTVLRLVKQSSQVTDCSWTTLDELKALIPQMHLTVSVDTGPVFIAEACDVPTIDIGGVIDPHDMAPNDGDRHVLITYGGEPLLWSMNSRVYDYAKVRAGIESITVHTVLREIDALVSKYYPRTQGTAH